MRCMNVKCPVCNDIRMREVNKDGIMIDVCPDCKGVWLDRGELEKLLADARAEQTQYDEWVDNQPRQNKYREYTQHDHAYPPDKYNDKKGYPNSKYPKKKKNRFLDALGDIFD